MSIKIRCVCGKELNIAEQYAGKRCKCPSCGRSVVVPGISCLANGNDSILGKKKYLLVELAIAISVVSALIGGILSRYIFQPEIIKVKEIHIIDENGTSRIKLHASDKDDTCLIINDQRGNPQIMLGSLKGNIVGLSLMNNDGLLCTSLAVTKDNNPGLIFWDGKGNQRVNLGTIGATTALSLNDQYGHTRFLSSILGKLSLTAIYNKDGDIIWSQGLAPTDQFNLRYDKKDRQRTKRIEIDIGEIPTQQDIFGKVDRIIIKKITDLLKERQDIAFIKIQAAAVYNSGIRYPISVSYNVIKESVIVHIGDTYNYKSKQTRCEGGIVHHYKGIKIPIWQKMVNDMNDQYIDLESFPKYGAHKNT